MANTDIDPRLRVLIDGWLPYLPPRSSHNHRNLTYERGRLSWLARALTDAGVPKYAAIWAVVVHLDMPDPGAAFIGIYVEYYKRIKEPWPLMMEPHLKRTELFTI